MLNNRGFALPITIFLIAILTLMLGSSFNRATTESQIASSSKWTVNALLVAQAGLEKYFGQDFSGSDRPLSGDSTRVDVSGGWTWIVPEVLITPADTMRPFRYLIRSTGFADNPSQPGDVLASRTVAQFADWQQPWLDAPSAALIAANGLDIKSTNVVLDGRDQPNPLCTGDPLVPDGFGARLPAPSYNDDLYKAEFEGSPVRLELGSRKSVAQLVNIDWAAIRADGFVHEYTSPQNGLTGDFPSQFVAGDHVETIRHFAGEGLLIVTGNLWVSSSSMDYWYWRGVILVGGEAEFESDTTYIYGQVITGLNYLTGGTASDTNVGGTQSADIHFDSCNIRKSLRSVKGFVPLENTWMDNWATF